MAKKSTILLPKTQKILTVLGENIRLARLRRNITAKLEAERARISIATLAKIESGNPNVSMGNYMQVLMTLRLGEDMLNVGKDDELGRKIQDAGLTVRRRASKRSENEY
jgi:transcriptional regulator with XRE-family HTH domain